MVHSILLSLKSSWEMTAHQQCPQWVEVKAVLTVADGCRRKWMSRLKCPAWANLVTASFIYLCLRLGFIWTGYLTPEQMPFVRVCFRYIRAVPLKLNSHLLYLSFHQPLSSRTRAPPWCKLKALLFPLRRTGVCYRSSVVTVITSEEFQKLKTFHWSVLGPTRDTTVPLPWKWFNLYKVLFCDLSLDYIESFRAACVVNCKEFLIFKC